MIRPILIWPDPILKGISSIVRRTKVKEFHTLIQDMLSTMYESNGVGLAAPQIGESKRIIVLDYAQMHGNPDPIVLINPKITKTMGTQISEEACLSIPGPTAQIKRHYEIEVEGLKPIFTEDAVRMEPTSFKVKDVPAVVFQHEIDHLEGIFFFDYLKPIAKNLYVSKMRKRIKEGEAWRWQASESL